MKDILKPMLVICLGLFIWTSCGDDGAEATSIDFQFSFMVDNENLELGKAYQLGGTTVQLETARFYVCLLYTSPSPRDATLSRMPSSA